MAAEFNRLITLLRKENKITQKQAAKDLEISQALLSHYEKGIRECGLTFVIKVADYYNVSCDYLLGRSPDRNGLILNPEEIPSPESTRDGIYRGSTLPTLNKKLIANSLNILYDKLSFCNNKELTTEISSYIMTSVYKMFRAIYSSNPNNSNNLFKTSKHTYQSYSNSSMEISSAHINAILASEKITDTSEILKDTSAFEMTTEKLTEDYPLYATSLLNLIKTCETKIDNIR